MDFTASALRQGDYDTLQLDSAILLVKAGRVDPHKDLIPFSSGGVKASLMLEENVLHVRLVPRTAESEYRLFALIGEKVTELHQIQRVFHLEVPRPGPNMDSLMAGKAVRWYLVAVPVG